MRLLSKGPLFKRLAIAVTALLCTTVLIVECQESKDRVLRNGWEIHRELDIAPEARSAVKDYFPSFLEYQDMVMFHPKFGYYSSGRVSFTDDYRTFPIVLAPLFGHMVAEQIFHMWQGMRTAGTLDDKEKFTIAEFGPGDGAMAESILDYLVQKSNSDPRWKQFASQVLYICYDRSPALNDIQRKRNSRFGDRFAARVADATSPTATIAPGSLKGVVLSNELPDAFSVHKIILSANGAAEVAFVVPSLPRQNWQTIRPLLSAAVSSAIDADDVAAEKKFFSRAADPATLLLTRSSFIALLENLLPKKEYESVANALQFQEVYVPVPEIPELAAHLRRYAPVYAGVLAKDPRGFVSYINPGVESFIHGAAQVLKSGYMLTIDYGSTWDGILADTAHFRTYGPAHREANQLAQPNAANPNELETSNPYLGPTLNDMTTDVNFSLLAAEGQIGGLKPVYFGSQRGLQAGTGISLDRVPVEREREGTSDEFKAWASDFIAPSVYKVFVQQKEGTDEKYRFPDEKPESLGLDQTRLTEAQLLRAAEIEKRLTGAAPGR